ncbi:hypothetical protein O9929_02635 [Vibrio lentus]|nr:hypothetical protein [Vibrio lentus]
MGISTLQSLPRRQILKLLVSANPVVEKYQAGMVSRIQGLTIG